MTHLIPLRSIPTTTARRAESNARSQYATRSAALDAASYRVEQAPGTHSRPDWDPPVVGWVVSLEAAEALAGELTRMPGGTYHRSLAYSRQA
jgi:hypothetical protein